MKFFDSHSHYYDERFASECEEGVDNLIGTLLSECNSYIINVGTSPETSRAAILQAKKFKNMYTAIGIHPSDSRFIDDAELALSEIESLILDKSSKCVCLGEIGLDYHYPDTDKPKQDFFFREQMRMAERLNMPVCIHDREAHGDVMEIVRAFPRVRGVLHSFSGSVEMAEELVSLGYMISFSGTLTFTNSRKPREVAAKIPREHILVETDCPYLAPHPLRGTLNHSGNLKLTSATLASILGISEEECALLTENNAKRLFGL